MCSVVLLLRQSIRHGAEVKGPHSLLIRHVELGCESMLGPSDVLVVLFVLLLVVLFVLWCRVVGGAEAWLSRGRF